MGIYRGEMSTPINEVISPYENNYELQPKPVLLGSPTGSPKRSQLPAENLN